MNKQHDFATRVIHAGQSPDPSTGAIMTPIYQTSTYVQESPGRRRSAQHDLRELVEPLLLFLDQEPGVNRQYR